MAIAVDVTSEADVARALAETEKLLAPPDILVASAGITGPNTTVAKYPVDAWRQVIDINLTGVFLCNRAVVDGMVQRGWGRIVNFTGMNAMHGYAGRAPVSVAKHGVWGLTKALGKEFGPKGITVNAIAPVLATQVFTPYMTASSKIGLLTSRMGSMTDNTTGGSYGYRMSKAALNAAGKSLSVDLKSRGIAVFLLHPGYVKTDMTHQRGLIDTAESARGLVALMEQKTAQQTGTFWHVNGEQLPW